MPEEAAGLAPHAHAPYTVTYAPPTPWFVSRRPYCDGRGAGASSPPASPRASAGAALAVGKTARSALRPFNAVEPMAPPVSCSPPPSCNGGAVYGCREYRYASNNWAASRWRRAYAPANKTGRDPQPQWRASKSDDGRRGGDAKANGHRADVDAGGAVDHGRTNTENFLPRIIKPRKRKKKDRKPSATDGASSSSASSTSSASSPQLPKKADDASTYPIGGDAGRLHASRSLLEGLRSAAAVAAALATDQQHGVDGRLAMLKSLRDFDVDATGADDVVAALAALVDAEAEDQEPEAVFCNCRYCDPQGIVWDVKEKRYSANLMRPGALSAGAYYGGVADLTPAPKSPVVDAGQPKKLQVSSQIVTSLNGHRDIEIKFYSSSSEKS